jgi:hypothetical protein
MHAGPSDRIALLGASTSLASIVVIGPHHARRRHIRRRSSEAGQREHMIRQGIAVGNRCEFLCLGGYLAPPRQVGGRAPRDALGRHTPPPVPAAGTPPTGP